MRKHTALNPLQSSYIDYFTFTKVTCNNNPGLRDGFACLAQKSLEP